MSVRAFQASLTYLHRQGVAFDIKSGRRTRLESGTRKKVQLTEELDLRALLSKRDVIDCFEQFSFVTQEALGHWMVLPPGRRLYAEVGCRIYQRLRRLLRRSAWPIWVSWDIWGLKCLSVWTHLLVE